eukprot:COSAG05_NODE_1833_length_3998_cov_5.510900_4_plen_173_part_01
MLEVAPCGEDPSSRLLAVDVQRGVQARPPPARRQGYSTPRAAHSGAQNGLGRAPAPLGTHVAQPGKTTLPRQLRSRSQPRRQAAKSPRPPVQAARGRAARVSSRQQRARLRAAQPEEPKLVHKFMTRRSKSVPMRNKMPNLTAKASPLVAAINLHEKAFKERSKDYKKQRKAK